MGTAPWHSRGAHERRRGLTRSHDGNAAAGNTPAELQAFIAKINHYQNTPPTGAMLTKASIAAQFQDTDEAGEVNDGREDRTFIQFAEPACKGLMRRVVSVDRIYEDNPTTTLTKFNDGTSLPADLLKPTFPWDGDGADVTAAWNAGRFLMVHRDHGWSDGWGDPFSPPPRSTRSPTTATTCRC